MIFEGYDRDTGEIFTVDLNRDWMIPICYNLGMAAGGVEDARPDTDHVEKPEWQYAYMRGYERGRRRLIARKLAGAKPVAKHGRQGKGQQGVGQLPKGGRQTSLW